MQEMNDTPFTDEELEIIRTERNRYQREYNKSNPDKRKVWNARYYLKLREKRLNEQGQDKSN